MKNLIKSIISYTALVGVPIICVGAVSASAYSIGHNDGMRDGLNVAEQIVKNHVESKEKEEE
jgi:hypothetical protein